MSFGQFLLYCKAAITTAAVVARFWCTSPLLASQWAALLQVIVSPLPQATRDLFAGAIKEEVEVYQTALQLHRAQLVYARAATVARGDVV